LPSEREELRVAAWRQDKESDRNDHAHRRHGRHHVCVGGGPNEWESAATTDDGERLRRTARDGQTLSRTLPFQVSFHVCVCQQNDPRCKPSQGRTSRGGYVAPVTSDRTPGIACDYERGCEYAPEGRLWDGLCGSYGCCAARDDNWPGLPKGAVWVLVGARCSVTEVHPPWRSLTSRQRTIVRERNDVTILASAAVPPTRDGV
jgi:hypothetical protein